MPDVRTKKSGKGRRDNYQAAAVDAHGPISQRISARGANLGTGRARSRTGYPLKDYRCKPVPENQSKRKTRERGAIRLVAAADAHGPYSGGLPPKVPTLAPGTQREKPHRPPQKDQARAWRQKIRIRQGRGGGQRSSSHHGHPQTLLWAVVRAVVPTSAPDERERHLGAAGERVHIVGPINFKRTRRLLYSHPPLTLASQHANQRLWLAPPGKKREKGRHGLWRERYVVESCQGRIELPAVANRRDGPPWRFHAGKHRAREHGMATTVD